MVPKPDAIMEKPTKDWTTSKPPPISWAISTGINKQLDIVKTCCKPRINEVVNGGLSSTPYIKFKGFAAILNY